jgi:hypothetical protein
MSDIFVLRESNHDGLVLIRRVGASDSVPSRGFVLQNQGFRIGKKPVCPKSSSQIFEGNQPDMWCELVGCTSSGFWWGGWAVGHHTLGLHNGSRRSMFVMGALGVHPASWKPETLVSGRRCGTTYTKLWVSERETIKLVFFLPAKQDIDF